VNTIFLSGGIGNNITKPAETTATQFIVIEDIAASPVLAGAVQIRINTTDYFQNPDVTQHGWYSRFGKSLPSWLQTPLLPNFR
jgi:hypothetical protein